MNKILEPTPEMLELGKIAPSIVLASSSPNRKKLLEDSNINVNVFKPSVDEDKTASSTSKLVALNAEKKLKEYLSSPSFDNSAVAISADTLVEVNNEILGKPEDEDDALRMLHSLSGREQIVYTGSALYNPLSSSVKVFTDKASVLFKELSDEEIEEYILTGEWKGAAGAYRLQKTGYKLVERIEGDWATVVGLPIDRIIEILSTD